MTANSPAVRKPRGKASSGRESALLAAGQGVPAAGAMDLRRRPRDWMRLLTLSIRADPKGLPVRPATSSCFDPMIKFPPVRAILFLHW